MLGLREDCTAYRAADVREMQSGAHSLPWLENRKSNPAICPRRATVTKNANEPTGRYLSVSHASPAHKYVYVHPRHRRAGHKSACSPAHNLHPNDVTLKLAERAIADPYIAQLLKCYSILSLDLLHDRSNATRFAVNVVCTTGPADIMADIARLASTGDANPDPNAPIRLKISTIRRVPLEETPRAVQKAAAESRSKGMGIRDPVTNALLPVITSYFSYSGARGEGQIMGEVFAVLMVDSMSLEYMASKPKVTLQSPMFGERELDMDMPTIQQ